MLLLPSWEDRHKEGHGPACVYLVLGTNMKWAERHGNLERREGRKFSLGRLTSLCPLEMEPPRGW